MTSLTEPGNDSHSSILEEKVQKGLLSLIPAQTMKKITPETYEEMNKEFIEEGTAVRIAVPTQEAIDKWLNHKEDIHSRTVEPVDMVAQLWKEHRERNNDV